MVVMGLGLVPQEVEKAAQFPENDFGKYVLVQSLGKGGMGEVFKAWEKALGRWVAIKMLKVSDSEDIARFQREAQIAARLNHSNIAAIYEIAQYRDRWYISMQYIDGRMLEDVSNLRQALRAVMQVAYAVHYAHAAGIIHRDINPRNIMIDRAGKGFITDFGIARQQKAGGTVTQTGVIVGTPNYMSPEQAQGNKVDHRTDIYSLGATLYYAATQSAPFYGEDPLKIVLKVIHEEPPTPRTLNPKIDRDLETIILKSMEKDPDRRYQTAKELGDDLKAFLNDEPISARQAGLAYRLYKKAKKHRVRLTIAVLLMMVLGLTTALFATRRNSPEPGPARTPQQTAAMLTAELRSLTMRAVEFFLDDEEIEQLDRKIEQKSRDIFAVVNNYGDVYIERARFYWFTGRYSEAEEQMALARQVAPENGRALLYSAYFRCRSYLLDRLGVALNNHELWRTGRVPKFLEPVDTDELRRKAEDARMEAREFLKRVREQDDPAARAFAQGLIAFLGRDYPEAERAFEAAKPSEEWHRDAALLQGLARLYRGDDLTGAEKAFAQGARAVRTHFEFRIMACAHLLRLVADAALEQRDPRPYEEALIRSLVELLKVQPVLSNWRKITFFPDLFRLELAPYLKQARQRLEGT